MKKFWNEFWDQFKWQFLSLAIWGIVLFTTDNNFIAFAALIASYFGILFWQKKKIRKEVNQFKEKYADLGQDKTKGVYDSLYTMMEKVKNMNFCHLKEFRDLSEL